MYFSNSLKTPEWGPQSTGYCNHNNQKCLTWKQTSLNLSKKYKTQARGQKAAHTVILIVKKHIQNTQQHNLISKFLKLQHDWSLGSMLIAIILRGNSRITAVQLLLRRYENFPLWHHFTHFPTAAKTDYKGERGWERKRALMRSEVPFLRVLSKEENSYKTRCL